MSDKIRARLRSASGGASQTLRSAALDRVSTVIMFTDRELRITYVNETGKQMLLKLAEHFSRLWAGFNPNDPIGACVDIFRDDPSQQRRLLEDASALPQRATIQVGPVTFALQMHANLDANGVCAGVMLEWTDVTDLRENIARLDAIDKAQASIEFSLDGTILSANQNFLSTTGYSLSEIRGQHHSMFVEASYRDSSEYRAFWDKLRRGEYDAGQYRRIGKGGREIWIQASYNPVFDPRGKAYKVVKYATDVTEQVKMKRALDSAVIETQAVVENAIGGDLTSRISTVGKTGQIEDLSKSVNKLIHTMMTVVGQIKVSAATVRNGTEEISKGNGHLSQRTEEQASSLAETSSSMEQMTSTVRMTADNAGRARQLSVAAREQADKGGGIVDSAVAAMAGINSSSKKISDIIGVIDEIAFQTNLLALNAAVEAARAGDQGRGFAVVATEVRSLAGRSATAAKEIKMLINDSVAKVEEGSKLVDASGKALGDIGIAVKHVTDVIAEIARASQEQAAGIEQVNKAVIQMDETTQHNAALVEEAAAASASMLDQATQLADMVGKYKVAGDGVDMPLEDACLGAGAPAETRVPSGAAERRGAHRPWSPTAAKTRFEGATQGQAPARRSAPNGAESGF